MRRSFRCRRLLGFALLACSLAVCAPGAADAAPGGADAAPGAADAAGIDYAALGDSYTSAPLIGPSASGVPISCQQSTNNYPHLVAAAIHAASLTDVSCSGAVIANLTQPQPQTSVDGLTNPPQLDALTPSTTLVTIGISANDASYFTPSQQDVRIATAKREKRVATLDESRMRTRGQRARICPTIRAISSFAPALPSMLERRSLAASKCRPQNT